MKAFVRGPLPPAPKPTLPRKVPDRVINKAVEHHDRIIGSRERMRESCLRGGDAMKRRAGKTVTRVSDEEREQIVEMLKAGVTQVEIQEQTGRDRKTIRRIKKAAGL